LTTLFRFKEEAVMSGAYCPGCGKGISPEIRASGFCTSCGKPLPTILPTQVDPARAAEKTPARGEPSSSTPSTVLAWGTVRAGLGLTFFGALLFCLCVLLLYVIGITVDTRRGTSALAVVAAFLSVGGLGVAACLALVGGCLGCAAPRSSGARGWALGVCAFLAASVVLGVVNLVAGIDHRRVEEENTVRILRGDPLAVSSWGAEESLSLRYGFYAAVALGLVCYLFFLFRVANSFRRRFLSAGVVLFLLVAGLFASGLVAVNSEAFLLPFEIPAGEEFLKLVLGGVAALAGCYVLLVGLTRHAITRGLLRA
jgi:hypothetical protein